MLPDCRAACQAGLLLGIGGALSNPNTLAAIRFRRELAAGHFTIASSAGSIVFAEPPVLFAGWVAVRTGEEAIKARDGLALLRRFW